MLAVMAGPTKQSNKIYSSMR